MAEVASDSILTPLHCCKCGYDLRGLLVTANCPECGQSIEKSRAEFTLAFAEPTWLRRIRLAGQFAVLAFSTPLNLMGVGALVWIASWLFLGTPLTSFQMPIFLMIFAFTTTFLCLSGWIATSPNPATVAREPRWSPRVLARGGLLLFVIWLLAAVVLWPRWFSLILRLGMIGSPFGLAGAVAVWGMTKHYEAIAALTGKQLDFGRARVYRVGFITMTAITNLLLIIAAFGPTIPALLACVTVAMQVIFGGPVVAFPIYLHRAVQAACGDAEKSEKRGANG